jgi:hypothetical protein
MEIRMIASLIFREIRLRDLSTGAAPEHEEFSGCSEADENTENA